MTSNIASCTNPNLSWAANSDGQSPCEIASILGGICFAGVYDVPALSGNQTFYTGPASGSASPCECNTVRYEILSACAACQSKDWLPWPTYSSTCDKVYTGSFPEKIPPSTKIPHYAFLPLGSDNRFNLTAAQAVANAPESAGVPQVTVTLTPTGSDAFSTITVTAHPTVTITPSGTSNPSTGATEGSTTKKSLAGPIAGAVVGGLVVVALFAAFIFWMLQRKREAKVNPPDSFNKALMTGGSNSTVPTSSLPPSTFNARLYDPSDPSTFPSPPVPFTVMDAERQPGYKGKPEV